MSTFALTRSNFGTLLLGTTEDLRNKLVSYETRNEERKAQTSFTDAYEYEANKIMYREDGQRIEDLKRELTAREIRQEAAKISDRLYTEWKNKPYNKIR